MDLLKMKKLLEELKEGFEIVEKEIPPLEEYNYEYGGGYPFSYLEKTVTVKINKIEDALFKIDQIRKEEPK